MKIICQPQLCIQLYQNNVCVDTSQSRNNRVPQACENFTQQGRNYALILDQRKPTQLTRETTQRHEVGSSNTHEFLTTLNSVSMSVSKNHIHLDRE